MGIVLNPFSGQLDFIGTGGSGPSSGPAERYTQLFTNATWGSPSGGYYTITVTQATHGKTDTPEVSVYEQDGLEFVKVQVQDLRINASGDVSISVPETPDLRFNGLILIL